MHWREVWFGTSPQSRVLRVLLAPLSLLYWLVWEGYLLIYRLGLKKPSEPHRPVLCIGNLVAGGSGKSPVTLYVAELLTAAGRKVVLGCSGYGAPHSEGATWAPDGPLDAREWGDEPAMFRSLAPKFPIIVGRNRVQAASICHEKAPDAILLMDDGFQHLPLRKHLSILLDKPQANTMCLPAGPYREPRRNRSRADLVLPNGFKPTFRIESFVRPDGTRISAPTGAQANVLCALADPSRFMDDLAQLGIHVTAKAILPDHDRLDAGNLFASLNQNLPVIVTAKDWVKLQYGPDISQREIWIARQEARIEPEAEFRDWLTRKLDELSNQ